MKPELIVMLTHNDKTVSNAVEIFEECKNTSAKFWGFKEIGLPLSDMKKLCQSMKTIGKTTFLEVVAYTEKECLAGAEMAIECGFDYLMGTKYCDSVNELVKKHDLLYFPFVGKIEGRPSLLYGTIEGIIDEAITLVKTAHVNGFDLLGYRFVGDAVGLNQEFITSIQKYVPVVLAGSISDYQKLDEVKNANPWAFTIGGAFFENKFNGTFAEQIDKVVNYMNR